MDTILKLLETAPDSKIHDAYARLYNKLREFKAPVCSISGGSDSDIMLHMCASIDLDKKIRYVFFDTGIEYQATKDHIKQLEQRYGIGIKILKAEKPVPYCTKKYGQPFLSKIVSGHIEQLQRYDFKWEDEDFEALYKKYPKCKAALRWWCNDFGEKSRFNIDQNRWLKEFMIQNPPTFKISNRCCEYAKKELVHKYIKEIGADLDIVGVRKSEGGARAVAYKSCFSPETDKHIAVFRPIFWFENDTKRKFEEFYGIEHSACYTEWGLTRTGCGGCPYSKYFDLDLKAIKNMSRNFTKLSRTFSGIHTSTREHTEPIGG